MTSNPADFMPFSRLMGVEITSAGPDGVEGSLLVRDDLCTSGGILHGGAIMAFADALGAVGAFATLPDGAGGTTTVESKTNFLAAAKAGTTVTGKSKALSTGRRISVWQTEISREDGKRVAVITQTQLVL